MTLRVLAALTLALVAVGAYLRYDVLAARAEVKRLLHELRGRR